MKHKSIFITKASGNKEIFSPEKLRKSLAKSGALEDTINYILAEIESTLHDGISTKEIYNTAFKLLKKVMPVIAGRYNLKRAIMAMGPSGFPFEKYIAAIFEWQGYNVKTQLFLEGACVTHEIDVLAENQEYFLLTECKYHNSLGIVSDVKLPLYIHSRYIDVLNNWNTTSQKPLKCCVVTNTKFSLDAIKYGTCAGLQMLGWDYPHKKNLGYLIDKSGLYPLTCLTTLTNHEKTAILTEGFVLCKDLLNNQSLFNILGISQVRMGKIILEATILCSIKN